MSGDGVTEYAVLARAVTPSPVTPLPHLHAHLTSRYTLATHHGIHIRVLLQGGLMQERIRAFLSGGFWAGFIGYVTVVVLVALFNIVAGRSPFYTAALFGNALVFGESEVTSVVIAPGPVLVFNMIHLLVFLVLGSIASLCVTVGERYPASQYALFTALFLGGLLLYAGLVLFGLPLLGSAAWWQVGGSGAGATLAMGWYLLRARPVLRRELKELQWGETPT